MCRRLPNVVQKLLQILLILQHVLVKVGHFSDADNLTALLQEGRDANVLCKRQQCVQVSKDLLIATLLVKLFKVFPVALERS